MDEVTRISGIRNVIGKRYALIRVLGQGGMAQVWLAEEVDAHQPNRVFAIKQPKDNDSNKISRFYREARAHWLLRESPHIVSMHGFEHPENGMPYLVLELMRGTSLKELLNDFYPFRDQQDRLVSGLPRPLALKLALHAVKAVEICTSRGLPIET